MILNGRTLSAQEALQYGMVNRLVPPDRCLDEAVALAQQIAARAPLAVRSARKLIDQASERPLADGLAAEREAFNDLFSTQDRLEGMQAFVEKRNPNWKGR
jgi:enoyl-CoA hydratase